MLQTIISFLKNTDFENWDSNSKDFKLEDLKEEVQNNVNEILQKYKNSSLDSLSDKELNYLKNTVVNFDFLSEVKKID